MSIIVPCGAPNSPCPPHFSWQAETWAKLRQLQTARGWGDFEQAQIFLGCRDALTPCPAAVFGDGWRWVMRKKTRILDYISVVGCCGWFARNLTFCLSGAAYFFSISAVEVTTICFTMPMFRWRVGSASCSWTPAMAMTSTPIPRGIRWTAAPGQIWKTLTWCGSRGWRGCAPWRQRWAQGMCSSCRVAGGTMCSRSLKIPSPSLPWWFQGGFLHLRIGVARIRERTICPSRPHAMLFFGEVLPSNEYDWVCHLTRDDAQSTGSHHFWHFDDRRLTFHGKPIKNLSCPATFLFIIFFPKTIHWTSIHTIF